MHLKFGDKYKLCIITYVRLIDQKSLEKREKCDVVRENKKDELIQTDKGKTATITLNELLRKHSVHKETSSIGFIVVSKTLWQNSCIKTNTLNTVRTTKKQQLHIDVGVQGNTNW